MQDNDGRKGLAWEQALGVLGVPFTVSIRTYKAKANVLKNAFQRAHSPQNCKNTTPTKKTRRLLVPVSCSTGMLHRLLTSFWRGRNGTLPCSNLLTAICFQSAGEELAGTPCYKQLILKGQHIPTVLRLRGRAPRQFSYKVWL